MAKKSYLITLIIVMFFMLMRPYHLSNAAQSFQVTPNPFDFGEVRRDATKITKTLSIKNTSNKTIDIKMRFNSLLGSMGGRPIFWLEEKKSMNFRLSPNQTETFLFAINPSLVTLWLPDRKEPFGNIQIQSFLPGSDRIDDVETIEAFATLIPKAPELELSDDYIDFSSIQPQDHPYKSVQVKNNGEELLMGSIETDHQWIQLSEKRIRLQPGSLLDLKVSIVTSFLYRGLNEGVIICKSNGGEKILHVKVFLLSSPPVLELSTESIDFGRISPDEDASDTLTVKNRGQSTLTGEFFVEEDWIMLSDEEFALEEDEELDITLSVDPFDLSPGKHSAWIDVISNGGETSIKVTLEIEEKKPILSVDLLEVDFGTVELGDITEKKLLIKNIGGKTLIGSFHSDDAFLSASPDSFSLREGESKTITIGLDAHRCSSGNNRGTITCNSNGGSKEISIRVKRELIRIELIIGKDLATVNGKLHSLPYPPVIQNGRTLVPLRFLAESMKINVEWDGNTNEITLKSSDKTILLKINSRIAYIFKDGKKSDVLLDAAPTIRNSTTIIPLRFVSENMDAQVEYEARQQKITVER